MAGKEFLSARKYPSIFVWDNLGPTHVDRISAASATLKVGAVEIFSRSATYSWSSTAADFERVTLFGGDDRPTTFSCLKALIAASRKFGQGNYFLCHYERPEIFLFALYLLARGSRVFAMIDSKFDDKPRFVVSEFIKSLALRPYHGALVGSSKSEAYLRFLGMNRKPMAGNYDALSIDRIRRQADTDPAPGGVPFEERALLCVARLVPKKNHKILLAAYARYRQISSNPRALHLCGDGAEQAMLQAKAQELGIAEHVHFQGFVQTEEISRYLGRSLALLLLSTEEQFGQVVLEAQAMGLPVIVSDNVGSRHEHVRSGVNGFVVEPDNIEGIARAMARISDDAGLWRDMAQATLDHAEVGDVRHFVKSINSLTEQERP